MADSKNSEEIEIALGSLINACSTLQSIVLGGIEGIERERALATFDARLQEAADARRSFFGDPAATAANPAVNPDDPVIDESHNSTGIHMFNVIGQT
jgi:hypothetical protein